MIRQMQRELPGWHAGEAAVMASSRCDRCGGYGAEEVPGGGWRPCWCVWRGKCRAVCAHYSDSRYSGAHWHVEFRADVQVLARRALSAAQWELFERCWLRGEPMRRHERSRHAWMGVVMGRIFRDAGLHPLSGYYTVRRLH